MTTKTDQDSELKAAARRSQEQAATPELKQQIAELQARESELLAAQEKQRHALLSAQHDGLRECWLITCPNPSFEGITQHFCFTSGMCFIYPDETYPLFELKPTPEKVLDDRYPLDYDHPERPASLRNQAARDRIRQREKISSAERAKNCLVNDWGYKASFYSWSELDQLQARIVERAKERAAYEEASKQSTAPKPTLVDLSPLKRSREET